MKKEEKEKAVEAANRFVSEVGSPLSARCRVQDDAKVLAAPDVYWVQAWISVSLSAVKS